MRLRLTSSTGGEGWGYLRRCSECFEQSGDQPCSGTHCWEFCSVVNYGWIVPVIAFHRGGRPVFFLVVPELRLRSWLFHHKAVRSSEIV